MGEKRTGSGDALEAIAWHLNFFEGQTLSVNEIAEATGLAWASARKFAAMLAMIRKIVPRVSLTSDGVEVARAAETATNLLESRMAAAALYLFLHARLDGSPKTAVPRDMHRRFAATYGDDLEDLVALGLAIENDGFYVLTDEGLALAGQTYRLLIEEVPETLAATSGALEAPPPLSGQSAP